MEIVLIWIVLAVGIALLANSRGRSGIGFFLMSLLLSPLLGLIVVLLMSDLHKAAAAESRRAVEEKEKDRLRREEHELQLESIKAIANPAAKAVGAVYDEVRKLGQLRDEGLLTQAEFEAQKAVVLGAAQAEPKPMPMPGRPSGGAPRSVEFGVCPNCDSTIPLLSETCPRCNAAFGANSSWAIKRITA